MKKKKKFKDIQKIARERTKNNWSGELKSSEATSRVLDSFNYIRTIAFEEVEMKWSLGESIHKKKSFYVE